MSFEPLPFPSPFPSPYPESKPLGLTMQSKLDFCMQKIMELEGRIHKLESSNTPHISAVKNQSMC